jgi:GntR family transcriptional regulator
MRDRLAALTGDPTPLYLQLARSLKEHIRLGGVDPGSALPSERDLSELMGMSRVTVRKGIEQLIEEGILVRRQGSGTFVAQRIVAGGSALGSFSEDALARGQRPGVVWITRCHAAASEEEAAALELEEGATVARLSRVRLANDEPLAIEHAVVPTAFLPDLGGLGDSLYEALELANARPVSGTQRIRASLATALEAEVLGIDERAEVLRIERRTRTALGVPVEFTRSAYRGDRYDFVSELRGGEVRAR